MDTSSMFGIMDVIVLGGGLYVLYQYFIMVTSGAISESMLIPKEINVKKCKDVKAYIAYMGTKQLIFGLIATACGALGLYQDYTHKISPYVYLGAVGVFLVTALWYSFALKKAFKTFWD